MHARGIAPRTRFHDPALFEVCNFHVSPMALEVLCDKSAMALTWFCLATKQATVIQDCERDILLDASLFQEFEKTLFISLPVPTEGLVSL
jgi:hypothetical protein